MTIFLVLLALIVLPILAIYCVSRRPEKGRPRWLPPVVMFSSAVGIWFYEVKIIACPSCNIRPDIIVVWPIAGLVFILGLVALFRDLNGEK
jgi:hypothetical protein